MTNETPTRVIPTTEPTTTPERRLSPGMAREGGTMETRVSSDVREMSIEAVVIRADGTREDLGKISYWHKDPVQRLIWWLRQRAAGKG